MTCDANSKSHLHAEVQCLIAVNGKEAYSSDYENEKKDMKITVKAYKQLVPSDYTAPFHPQLCYTLFRTYQLRYTH